MVNKGKEVFIDTDFRIICPFGMPFFKDNKDV
jgi:hypothetical protein